METISSTPTPQSPRNSNNWLIPLSIVIAGLLIGGGIFGALLLTRGNSNSTGPVATRPVNPHLEKNMTPVSSADHIRGKADAPITLVEYSDTDCYYCNKFLVETIRPIINPYIAQGKVNWVYRHFNTGISSHPHTEIEAEATECVAQLGGNDKFWQFVDMLFDKKDFESSPAKLIDPNTLPTLVASIGINKAQFSQCLTSGKNKSVIATMTQNAQAAGGRGTPYSIITSKAVINADLKKMVSDVNNQILGDNTTAQDVLYVSSDGHEIVLGGAMPPAIMTDIMTRLLALNS